MIDESNDHKDKSCIIILVRVVDPELGDVCTRLIFLDMPIVNIGTARNLFNALQCSLQSFGIDFSRPLHFVLIPQM